MTLLDDPCDLFAHGFRMWQLFEQQNRVAYDAAFVEVPATLQIPTDMFSEKFGIGWRAVLESKRLVNGVDAAEALNVSFKALHALWLESEEAGNVHRLAPGVFCGQIKVKGKQALYVVNGHIPAMYDTLTAPGASVFYYVVTWDAAHLSYADFMTNVVGLEDFGTASPGSIRGTLYKKWSSLQMFAAPSKADPGLYASSCPFRAFADVCSWLGVEPTKDFFGKRLLEEGIREDRLLQWFDDPITINPENGAAGADESPLIQSLSEILNHRDAEDCISLCSRLNHVSSTENRSIFASADAASRAMNLKKRAKKWRSRLGEKEDEIKKPQLSAFIHALEGSAWSQHSSSRASGSDAGSDVDSAFRSSASDVSSTGEMPGKSDRASDAEEQKAAKHIRKLLNRLKDLPGMPPKEDGKTDSTVDSGKSRGGGKKRKPRLPSLPNAGLLIVDPSVICDKFIRFVRKGVQNFGGVVRSAGYISADEMSSRQIIDQHFYRIADEAVVSSHCIVLLEVLLLTEIVC